MTRVSQPGTSSPPIEVELGPRDEDGDHDQHRLDDEAGGRGEDAGADRDRGWQALLLEEPDVEGRVAGRATDEPGEGVGELHAGDGTERQPGGHRAEHRHRLRELGELGEDEGHQDPPPDRVREDVAHRGHAGELGHQEVHAEGERGGEEHRAEREAVQLGGLGWIDAGQRRARLAEVLRAAPSASVRWRLADAGQRRGLEQGQQLHQVVAGSGLAARPPGLARHRRARPWWRGAARGRAGAGCPRPTRRASPSPTSAGGPVVDEHDVARPRVAVGDAPVVQAPEVGPRVVEDGIGDLRSGRAGRAARPAGLRTTRSASSRHPASPAATTSGSRAPGPLGEEQHVGLVLDLVLAGERQRRARSPCTRGSARAWRTAARRCCPGRRPRSRARRRSPAVKLVEPQACSGASRRPSDRRRGHGASRRPGRRTAWPPASRGTGARGPPRPRRARCWRPRIPAGPVARAQGGEGAEPEDRLEQATAGRVTYGPDAQRPGGRRREDDHGVVERTGCARPSPTRHRRRRPRNRWPRAGSRAGAAAT